MNKMNGSQILAELTRWDKYAQHVGWAPRKENWEETVYRTKQMHKDNFKNLHKELDFAFDMVYKKEVSPSMRSLQFGGSAIDRNPAKIFNCSFAHLSNRHNFREFMYLLLCGSGVGFSVQKHHIDQLPAIVGPNRSIKRRYRIADSIEGWADSLDFLLKSYMEGGAEVIFDYSDIRPQGSVIKSTGAEAPGPDKLKEALENIRTLLDKAVGRKLRPIEGYDIVCYSAECVRSGGIRRSALICLFSRDDEEMLLAKSGNWWEKNAQRAMSNNSMIVLRGSMTKQEFYDFIYTIKRNKSGEPGIVWTNDLELGVNPCQPKDALVLTPSGISTFGDIKEGDLIWSETGWTKVLKKWSNGNKQTYKYHTTAGVFYGTANHRIVSNGVKVQVGQAKSIDRLAGNSQSLDRKDQNFLSEVFNCHGYKIKNSDGFLLKNVKSEKAERLQVLLSSIGIFSVKDKERNGFYDIFLREEDVLKITDANFSKEIIYNCNTTTLSERSSEILKVEDCGIQEVFDITVDNDTHTYWTGGVNVSNCVEISLKNKGFCNLTSQNMAIVKDQEHFLEMCLASAIIGTVQSAYTDFIYLSEDWKKNAEDEALLGCSMTGICDNYEVFKNLNLRQGAEFIVEMNKNISKKIGIRQSKRTTAIKPEGTNSLFLGGVAPGCHAQHDPFFIRRFTLDKHTAIYKFLLEKMPHLVEDSIMNPNQAYFCAPVAVDSKSAIFRHEPLINMLERVKYLHHNWIRPGHNEGTNTHNVSATVSVREDEWDTLAEWMWDNQDSYSGLAILPYEDSSFPQLIYQTIDEQKYNEMSKHLVDINLDEVELAAKDVNLVGESACAGGACLI